MSDQARPPLLISVPPAEFAELPPIGSVFEARRLLGAGISTPLFRALSLVFQTLQDRYADFLCVARPEIFTHGELLDWLSARIGGATDHLCLSDGQAVKAVPGLRNLLFVYGLERQSAQQHLRNLLRRAPEQLDTFHEQFNAAHATGTRGEGRLPDPRIAGMPLPLPPRELVWYYPLYLNRHSHEDSAERMVTWGKHEMPKLGGYGEIVLVAATDAAMHDENFCQALGQLITRSARSKDVAVLITLPHPGGREIATNARIGRALTGLQRGEVPIPRVRLNQVQFMSEIDETELLTLGLRFKLMLHDSFPLWSLSAAFYAQATEVRLYSSRTVIGRRQEGLMVQEALLARDVIVESWSVEQARRFGYQ